MCVKSLNYKIDEGCKKGVKREKKTQKTKKLDCKLIGSFGIQSSAEGPAPVLQPHNKFISIQLPPSAS